MSFPAFYRHIAAGIYQVVLSDLTRKDVTPETFWQLWHGDHKPKQEAAA